MQMEFSLRQLGYFLRLVERGSFTAAADTLGITQPALSIAIAQLEKALGATLIERSASPLGLTDEGRVFYRYALRVERELAEAREELAALGNGTVGRLEICMGPSAATPEVGAALTSMALEFPGLDIAVSLGVAPTALEQLHDGEFSLYVGTIAEAPDPRFTVARLADLRLLIVAAAEHPLATRRRVDVTDLASAAWIEIGNLEGNVPGWAALFQDAGCAPPRPAINVRNLALVQNLLGQAHFLTVLPESMIAAQLQRGIFKGIAPDRFSWNIPLSLVAREGKPLPAAARILRSRLLEQFGVGRGLRSAA
jgi:DNA-binding transcriptional LysR family regulator